MRCPRGDQLTLQVSTAVGGRVEFTCGSVGGYSIARRADPQRRPAGVSVLPAMHQRRPSAAHAVLHAEQTCRGCLFLFSCSCFLSLLHLLIFLPPSPLSSPFFLLLLTSMLLLPSSPSSSSLPELPHRLILFYLPSPCEQLLHFICSDNILFFFCLLNTPWPRASARRFNKTTWTCRNHLTHRPDAEGPFQGALTGNACC